MIVQVSNELDGMAGVLRNDLEATRANEADYLEMQRENTRIDAMFPHLRGQPQPREPSN